MRQEEVSFAKKRSTFVKLTTVIIAVVVAVSVGIVAYFSMPKAAIAANGTNNNSVQQAADTELGAPAHRKYIKDNGDGTYRLSLDVTGNEASSEDSTTITKNKPLDIVLVLDVSGSMNFDIDTGLQCVAGSVRVGHGWNSQVISPDSGYDGLFYNSDGSLYVSNRHYYSCHTGNTRMAALKTAAASFLTKIDDKNSEVEEQEKNRVALVKFAGDEGEAIGDEKYQDNDYWYNYSQIVQPLTRSVARVKDDVQNLSPGGATQSDKGLNKAKVVLADARPEAQKVVVFFTDGVPTSGNTFEDAVAKDAINTALNLKTDGSKVYSIGVFGGNSSSDVDRYMRAVSSACRC